MDNIKDYLQEILALEISKVSIERSIFSFKELETMLDKKRHTIELEINRLQSLNQPVKNTKKNQASRSNNSNSQQNNLNRINTCLQEVRRKSVLLESLLSKVIAQKEKKYLETKISSYFQSLFPISYFVQLFELGVIKELQGINGGYNIYQSKISSGELEEYTLEEAIKNINTIKQKQFIAFNAIQQSISLQRKVMIETLSILDVNNPESLNLTHPRFLTALDQITYGLEENLA